MKKDKENKPRKTKEKVMDIALLESELIPKDKNVIKEKTVRDRKSTVAREAKTTYTTFATLDPFNNCNDFYSFYMSAIKQFDKTALFYDISYERNTANEILDTLHLNSKDNMLFLRAWIKYYVTNYLSGENIHNQNKTSLKTFKDTFTKFNAVYIG